MPPSGNSLENQPHFELPQSPGGQEKQTEQSREKPTTEESAVGSAQPASAPMPAVPDLSGLQVPALPAQPSTDQPDDIVTASPAAADNDRIEKEWVNRAKTIIAQTKDDPHEQKKEISKVKAEYIRQRFGKNVPTDDAVRA